MNIEEKLLESHKSVSKISATLLALIFVMSVYVMQRALAVIGFSPSLLRQLTGQSLQISLFNLGFSYRTMTVLWPGVLGGLCVIYTLLENKRSQIEHSLKRISNETEKSDVNALDPFYFSSPLFQSRVTRTVAHLLALFPMIAIATHLFMIFIWIAVLGLSAFRHTRLQEYLAEGYVGASTGAVFSLSSILFSVVGFLGALAFWRTLRKGFIVAGGNKDKDEAIQQNTGDRPGDASRGSD